MVDAAGGIRADGPISRLFIRVEEGGGDKTVRCAVVVVVGCLFNSLLY
jgi:hypothetical protein